MGEGKIGSRSMINDLYTRFALIVVLISNFTIRFIGTLNQTLEDREDIGRGVSIFPFFVMFFKIIIFTSWDRSWFTQM